jgi:hypothetical protein
VGYDRDVRRGTVGRLRTALMWRLKHWLGLTLARVFVNRYAPAKESDAAFDRTVTHRVASREELLRACVAEDLKLTPDLVGRRLEDGEICVSSFDGERLVGYDWYSRGPIDLPDSDLRLRFSPDLVYSYHSFVLPAYRGRSIGPARWRFSHGELLKRGWTGSIYFVELHNASALTATFKMPTVRPVGYFAYCRIFGRWFHWSSPGCRRRGVSIFG